MRFPTYLQFERKRSPMDLKRQVSIALTIILILPLLLSFPVVADDGAYGNDWVYDEPQVISAETEEYIKNLNENIFANYSRKPQLAIVVINDLPYSIDKYKLDTFNELGVGTAEENCGMLFIFAINDREYALEIGDGFEKGSLLRQDLETDFITEDMKNSLRSGDYDTVVLQVAQYLEGIMANEENGTYAQWEAEKLAAQKLREEQAAARAAARTAKLKQFGIILGISLLTIAIIALIVILVKKYLRSKKIKTLCSGYSKYLRASGITEDEFTGYLKERYSATSNAVLEEKFLDILHQYYLTRQIAILNTSANHIDRLPLYKEALRKTNNLQAFKQFRLTPLDRIIYQVDETEREKEEMQRKNAEIIEQFLQANKHRIMHESTFKVIRATLYKHQYSDKLVSQDVLEKDFAAALKEQNFRWEADRFIKEHLNKNTQKYFNRDAFYQELEQSERYYDYHYSRHYDNTWMYVLYAAHIARGRRTHQERLNRQEEQRKAEERRRQEEANAAALRAATERIRTTNSSFGSGFRGGSSSGGGFKGGW